MYFASGIFIFFFLLLFTIYWSVPNRFRHYVLLSGSYFFYGYWSIPFLSLLIFSTLVDFVAPIAIVKYPSKKKRFLLLALFLNFGLLGFFKYGNFFIEQFNALADSFGTDQISSLDLILPLGISFYTFQTVSHTIDTFRGKREPESSLLIFANYVSFFPQLIAGPIERSKKLIPQFHKKKEWKEIKFQEAFWDIGIGIFKKLFIADNLLQLCHWSFFNFEAESFVGFWTGSIAATLWLYTDFGSYSDIAIGLGKLLGFELSVNFRKPFFCTNPREFWRNWHITLGDWFRDYVYNPILESKGRNSFWLIFATLLTMMLIGFWHGPKWTFVFFGLFHGLAIIVWRLTPGPTWPPLLGMTCLFAVLNIYGGTFFIAKNLGESQIYIQRYFDFSPFLDHRVLKDVGGVVFFYLPLFAIEVVQHRKNDDYYFLKIPSFSKSLMIIFFVVLFISKGSFGANGFYYFQF